MQRDAVRDMDRRDILGNRVRVEMSNANKLVVLESLELIAFGDELERNRGSSVSTLRRDDYGDRRYGRSPDRGGRGSPRRYGR